MLVSRSPAGAAATGVPLAGVRWSTRGPPPAGKASGTSTLPSTWGFCMSARAQGECETAGWCPCIREHAAHGATHLVVSGHVGVVEGAQRPRCCCCWTHWSAAVCIRKLAVDACPSAEDVQLHFVRDFTLLSLRLSKRDMSTRQTLSRSR